MDEDNQEIVITDMEPKVFKALLHFMYRDTLIEDEELSSSSLSSPPSVSDTLAAKLLAASHKYELPRLRLMCESVLCKDISVNSVAKILALADCYGAVELKSVCLKFAAENLVAKDALVAINKTGDYVVWFSFVLHWVATMLELVWFLFL
ncbi:hypothetical protein ACFE04_026863 [Oxalis oulophora]